MVCSQLVRYQPYCKMLVVTALKSSCWIRVLQSVLMTAYCVWCCDNDVCLLLHVSYICVMLAFYVMHVLQMCCMWLACDLSRHVVCMWYWSQLGGAQSHCYRSAVEFVSNKGHIYWWPPLQVNWCLTTPVSVHTVTPSHSTHPTHLTLCTLLGTCVCFV